MYQLLTSNTLQWIQSDLWSSLIRFAQGRGIQDSVEEHDLGVVEDDPPGGREEGGHAAAERHGEGGTKVHQGEEERLQSIVQGLQQCEPEP